MPTEAMVPGDGWLCQAIRSINRRKLARSAKLIIVLGLSKLAALMSAVVIARFFDRETSGIIFFASGIVTVSVSVTTLGIAAASSYYYSRNLRRSRHSRNWQVYHLALLVAILPSLLLGLMAYTMDETRGDLTRLMVPVLAISCFMAAIRILAKMFFTIENKREWSLIHDNLSYNFLIIVAIVGWWLLLGERPLGPGPGLFALLVASLLSGLFAVWHTLRLLTSGRGTFDGAHLPSYRYIKVLIAISLPSMLVQGGALVLNKIDVLMIGPLGGAIEVGTYSVAMRVTYLAGLLTEIISLFLAPRIIAIGASGNPAEQWSIFKLATKLQVVALIITSIPLIIFNEIIITIIFGEEYIDVSDTYIILQSGKLMTGVFLPVIVLFTALGYNREMAKTALLAAIVNIGLNFALIPRFGANGAALATTLALLIMFVNYLQLAWRIRCRAQQAVGA